MSKEIFWFRGARFKILEGKRGVREAYNCMADDYDYSKYLYLTRKMEKSEERITSMWIRKLSSPVLDVGCGTGLILRKLHGTPIGLDINPWAVRRAGFHAPNAHRVIADAEHMPIRSNALPAVVCTEVLEHLPRPKLAVKEIWRVLKEGGLLIGSVPNRTFLWRFRVLSSTCPHEEPFHNMYRMEEVEKLIEIFRKRTLRYSLLRLNVLFIARK